MIHAMDINLSALKAANTRLDVTADNIANINTDEFKKSRVNFQTEAGGGVSAQMQKINTPGIPKESIRGDDSVEVESSNVDMAEELTRMMPTTTFYTSNLKAIRTSSEMLGTLMDILG